MSKVSVSVPVTGKSTAPATVPGCRGKRLCQMRAARGKAVGRRLRMVGQGMQHRERTEGIRGQEREEKTGVGIGVTVE